MRVMRRWIIISQAVLIAVAVDGDGQRQIIGVDLANRESRTSWRDFLLGLKDRIEALGGTFSVYSPAGRGTTVSCELPVNADGEQ